MTEGSTSLEVAVKECEYYSNEEKQQVIEEINIMINVSNTLRKQVSNLSDIHIVKMLGYFFNEEDYKAYIVLEYCPEGDLRNYINKMKKTGMQIIIEKFYEMAGELAQSLNQLHSNGILHMDLKPENVLLTDQFKVKLADFGLARQLQISQHYTTNHAGTWQYQPPEKLQKNGVTEYTQIKEKVEKKEKEVKKDKKTKGDNHKHVHMHHHKDEINDQVDVKDNNELKIEKDKKMGKDQDKQKLKELDKQQMKEKEIEDLKDKIKEKEKQRKDEKEKEMNKKEKDYDEDLKDKHKEKEKEKKKEKSTEKDKKEKDLDEEQNIEKEKNREKGKEKGNEKKKKNEYQKEKEDKKEEKKEKDLDDKLKDKEKEQEKETQKEKDKVKEQHNNKDKDKDKDEKQIVKENEKENRKIKEKDVDKDKHLDKDKHKHKDNEKEKQEKPKIHPQAAVDMWAFGVMLYELVAQRHPFFDFKSEGDIPIQEFINRVVNLPPAELPRIYPQELKDLIYQLLDKNPSRRITAEAILQLPDVAKTLQNKQQKKD
ncbi:MAG: hypothetical protein EZS28_005167 [Streblomastix strix]|uniref:non-specific serine/threonine protein kinase n=1 Tax=Streblomastix strix TaxID=222440 RepID=A0A5J4WWZ9_9EUKA|nr:MAG: hypothetical protein EZS28_005167 [Streblomastix strix]